MSTNRIARQMIVVSQAAVRANQETSDVALFAPDGSPVVTTAFTGTGATVPMTSYAGHAAGNVAAADTVNDAIGKLEARIAALEAHDTSAEIVITGYTEAGAAAALSATDTLNVALGKLEKRIEDLEP